MQSLPKECHIEKPPECTCEQRCPEPVIPYPRETWFCPHRISLARLFPATGASHRIGGGLTNDLHWIMLHTNFDYTYFGMDSGIFMVEKSEDTVWQIDGCDDPRVLADGPLTILKPLKCERLNSIRMRMAVRQARSAANPFPPQL